jgi:REP element-mobilizing transposase RayT
VTDIQLLWLAPDHLHVYCESDGTASPEEIVVHLKSASEKALMADISDVLPDTMNPKVLWDKSYFMESIG